MEDDNVFKRTRCIEWAEALLEHHLVTAKLVHSVAHALKAAASLSLCAGVSNKEASIWRCFCAASIWSLNTLVLAGQCRRGRSRHPVAFQSVKKLDSTFRDAVAHFLVPYLAALRQDGVEEEDPEEEEWSMSALVDTVCCKCPVLLGDEAAYAAQQEALFSGAGSNECVVAECELLLKQSQLAQRLA